MHLFATKTVKAPCLLAPLVPCGTQRRLVCEIAYYSTFRQTDTHCSSHDCSAQECTWNVCKSSPPHRRHAEGETCRRRT